MFINGTADPIVPYDGSRFGTLAASATYTFWQTLHNCTSSAAPTTHLPDISNDGTTVDLLRNTGCGAGGELRLYTVNGGDHAWRSDEQTAEHQSLMRISYAVFCLNKNCKKKHSRYH